MSKERLEELLKESPFNQHTEEFLIKLEDMNEITKIVEELEEDLLELVKQNKRYREALEFYADERNYEERDFGVIKQNAIQEGDKGNTARKALEESDYPHICWRSEVGTTRGGKLN